MYLFSTPRRQGLSVLKTLRKRGLLACFLSLTLCHQPVSASLHVVVASSCLNYQRQACPLWSVRRQHFLALAPLSLARRTRGTHPQPSGSLLLDLHWALLWCHTAEVRSLWPIGYNIPTQKLNLQISVLKFLHPAADSRREFMKWKGLGWRLGFEWANSFISNFSISTKYGFYQ